MSNREVKSAKDTLEGRLRAAFSKDDLLSTGCTLVDLALSGDLLGGIIKGHYYYFVGDSESGKSFFVLTMLAAACNNVNFDDYDIIYDDVERGALMDLEKFFGSKLAGRIRPPSGTKDDPIYSNLVEEFYFNIDDAFNRKRPFIYVLDSQDALDSMYNEKKFKELKTSMRVNSAKKAKGSMGDGKAKFHSQRIRSVVTKLEETGSILVIVNQTRDVINESPMQRGPKTKASGGHAVRFYASTQLWTTPGKLIEKQVRGVKRQIGVWIRVKTKKNRISGKHWNVEVPIYWSVGIDDVGANMQFLLDNKHWTQDKSGRIAQEDFDGVSGDFEDVVRQIEENDLESDLRDIVQEVFRDIEQRSAVVRKKRFA